jgi:hypothetical protein
LLSSKSIILRLFGRVVKRERANWRLHPLIHTFLKFNLAQDIVGISEMQKIKVCNPHSWKTLPTVTKTLTFARHLKVIKKAKC